MQKECVRMRRILSFLIDLILFYLPSILCTAILHLPLFSTISILIILIAVVASFTTFLLRDYLFNGRSIGKRIFRLTVLDAYTLSKPSAKQLIVKNLFLFLYPIDALFLLISGRSLGERATRTIVMREPQPICSDPLSNAPQAVSEEQKTTIQNRIKNTVFIVLLIALSMFFIISIALNAVKKQENYQIAYSYLVDSDTYAETKAAESQITLTGYSSSTKLDHNGETISTIVTFTFLVQGQQYQVVCHQNDGMWYVCSDCTDFQ